MRLALYFAAFVTYAVLIGMAIPKAGLGEGMTMLMSVVAGWAGAQALMVLWIIRSR